MKVKVNGKNRDFQTVWMEKGKVKMINQLLLPEKFSIASFNRHEQVAKAIKDMVVRGAPAIGATAAYGLSLAALEFNGKNFKEFKKHLINAKKLISATRPTAVDLFKGLEAVEKAAEECNSIKEAQTESVKAAENYAEQSAEECRRIGIYGEKLLKNGSRVLTHCNAGWLACVDFGTATAPIYIAKRNGKNVFCFIDETRPRMQGAKLTAWEFAQEGIRHAVIADNAAGYFMKKGEIDIVLVGADRIAANGDFANKIGTYEKAVLAKENGIPFYVAAPLTTFDLKMKNGKKIPVEERDEKEVLEINGKRIAPKESRALNPGFDVTETGLVSGIITPKGIIKAEKKAIKKLFRR